MNAVLAIPLELRLATSAAAGACAGILVDWAVACLASHSPQPHSALRRWGTIAVGAALFAGLYWWVVVERGTLMAPRPIPPPRGFLAAPSLDAMLHVQWLAVAALSAHMLAASLADVAERSIPDEITVPGTLLGLALAGSFPWSRLPADAIGGGGWMHVDFLKITSPLDLPWPGFLGPSPRWSALATALACYGLWIVALLPRPWTLRRGWRFALTLLAVRMLQGLFQRGGRSFAWRPMLAVALAGAAGIVAAWCVGGAHWIALLSALVGLVTGGAIVWIVRVVGKAVLRREAMGFGDVTLMAMIGSYLGWQPCLIVFFVAPLLGLVFGMFQWLVRGESELYYGPFLCAATLAVIVRWEAVWEWAWPIFQLGWIIPAIMVVAFALMGVLLWAIQWAKRALR